MDKSSRLFQILAIAFFAVLSGTVAFAAPSTQPMSQTQLIVWAHTNLENQGAPTLDILDLERYFVSRLEGRIANILPSQTAGQSNLTSPNAYLAELSVDAITPSVRAVQNPETRQYKEDPVFYVELSLSVKQPGSGKLLGYLRESQEYHLEQYDLKRLQPKRVALYKSADNLADRFADGIANGEFGEQLRSLHARSALPVLAAAFLVLAVAMVVVAFIVISNGGKKNVPPPVAEASPAPRERPEPTPHLDDLSAERLNTAVALFLATDNFSQAKLWEAAHDRRDAILDRAEEIQKEEARQRLKVKYYEATYARIADIATATTSFSRDELIAMMRKTDEWDYRLLREAQQQFERGCADAAEAN